MFSTALAKASAAVPINHPVARSLISQPNQFMRLRAGPGYGVPGQEGVLNSPTAAVGAVSGFGGRVASWC